MSRRNFHRALGLLLSIVVQLPSLRAEGDTYRLTYHFKSGQFFHFETEDKAEMLTQNAAVKDKEGKALQSKSIQHTQMLKSCRVVVVDENGVATLEPVVEKVRMSSQSGDNRVLSYDSTKDEVPAKEFETLASTIGRPLARFQFKPNGTLLKVTMLATDVPKNFSDAAEKVDPAINFLIVFPEKAIKIGETWSETYETPVSVGAKLNQPIKLIRTYEITKIANDVASIRFRTSLLTPMNDPEILRQLVQQTPTGTIEFDMAQGCLLSRSIRVDEKVVSAFGPQTLLQARGESSEKLLPANSPARISSGIPKSIPK